MTHAHQIPPGHVLIPVPTITTCPEAQIYLTDVFTHLSEADQRTFRSVAQQHPNWAASPAIAQAFINAVHQAFTLTRPADPAPQPQAIPPAPHPPVQTQVQPPIEAAAPRPGAAPVHPQPATPAVQPTEGQTAPPPPATLQPDLQAPPPTDSTPEHAPDDQPEPTLAAAVNPDGLFSQLHAMCADKETVTLYVARSGDQLTVTLLPTGLASEPRGALIPLSVQATPAELDAEFAPALTEYVALRSVQREKGTSVASQVKRAVTHAKDKKGAKTPEVKAAAPTKGTVTLGSNVPAKATIKGSNGKEHHAVGPEHRTVELKPGTYTVTVAADGYLESQQTVTVTLTEPQNLQFQLQQTGLGF